MRNTPLSESVGADQLGSELEARGVGPDAANDAPREEATLAEGEMLREEASAGGRAACVEGNEDAEARSCERGGKKRGFLARLRARKQEKAGGEKASGEKGTQPKVKLVSTAAKALRRALLKVRLPRRKKRAADRAAVPGEQLVEGAEKSKSRSRLVRGASNVWNKAVNGVGFSVAFGAAAAGSLLLFRMLNRTKVHGLKNVPVEHENVLYCLNHCSLLDNFAFEAAAYVPKVLFRRKYLPINLADRKNFFGDPSSRRLKDRVLTFLGRHFFRHLKAYPVDRRSGDMGQVEQWKELLADNIVIVFPEGTRTRTGVIGAGKPGVGKLIYEARPIVMPVQMTGTDKVLGVGMKCPAVFRKIEVFIGKPMHLDYLLNRELPEDRKERMLFYAEISDAVMDAIRYLNPATRDQVGKVGVRRFRNEAGVVAVGSAVPGVGASVEAGGASASGASGSVPSEAGVVAAAGVASAGVASAGVATAAGADAVANATQVVGK